MAHAISPNVTAARMLAYGDKLSASEVRRAVSQLDASARRISEMEKTVAQQGDGSVAGGARLVESHLFSERQQLARAADLIVRIGAGEDPLRRQDFPESLLDAIERVDVTKKARGVAARHGALLQTFADQRRKT